MEKEHIIFGIRAFVEAITAGKEVYKVFIQSIYTKKIRRVDERLNESKIIF
jgi:hypothetical protein